VPRLRLAITLRHVFLGSPVLAHRDILRRRAISVAFGVEADINS
jgi:hypothetical protein